MPVFVDARIPVVFGQAAGPRDALLPPSSGVRAMQQGHPAGCACCIARAPGAEGLDRLFLDRVRGAMPWFDRVVVERDDPALRHALLNDPVLSARYRLG